METETSNTLGQVGKRYVGFIDEIDKQIEQSLIDTYSTVVIIKKHGVVSL